MDFISLRKRALFGHSLHSWGMERMEQRAAQLEDSMVFRVAEICWSAVLPVTVPPPTAWWTWGETTKHGVILILWTKFCAFRQLKCVILERQMKASYGAIFLLIDSLCATRQGSSHNLLQKNRDRYKEADLIPQCWGLHNTGLRAQGQAGDT